MQVIIMRGLPGSGKSTVISQEYPNAVVCSADHHFEDDNGNYNFRPWEIAIAHQKCQLKFFLSLTEGIETIVVDNTNVSIWEFNNYITQAKYFGYDVVIRSITPDSVCDAMLYAARNKHGVPEKAVLAMFHRWEADPAGY